jgi:hypothetical protein
MMKNYRFLGDEAEVLGNRLDHARQLATTSKSAWAKNYWSQTVERLLFQWRQLPVLHDGDARTTIIPRWTVDYNFYEHQQEGNLYGVTDRFYDSVFKKEANLHESWENHRAQRLARCQ